MRNNHGSIYKNLIIIYIIYENFDTNSIFSCLNIVIMKKISFKYVKI